MVDALTSNDSGNDDERKSGRSSKQAIKIFWCTSELDGTTDVQPQEVPAAGINLLLCLTPYFAADAPAAYKLLIKSLNVIYLVRQLNVHFIIFFPIIIRSFFWCGAWLASSLIVSHSAT